MLQEYDAVAERHLDVERVFGTYRHLVEIPSLLRALGAVEGLSVLDAGCGTGDHTRLVGRLGAARALGVDSSPAMIEVARRSERSDPSGAEFEVHDITDMPVLGSFDAVLALAVLHYAEDAAALRRMCERAHANLAAGGRLLAYVANPELPVGAVQFNGLVVDRSEDPADGAPYRLTFPTVPPTTVPARYWSRRSIEEALRAVGFSTVTWEPLEGIPGGVHSPINLLVSAAKG
ncbi:class I SAM-dependent methyltransferase [Nocardiopsis sp. CNT-189]|uniref:class I SAM-dependent methyltransferase n=1 Tax=Nocardiopsis oceanisediminis TaxID=2816862 RepID=UPI003B355B22